MPTGGAPSEISIDGRIFTVAADSDITRDLGGFSKEIQMNGNGTSRDIMTRKAWMLDGCQISIDDDRGDQEFLQTIQNTPGYVPIVITYPSLISYEGEGTVSGDLGGSSQSTTATINLSGPGNLKKQ